MEKLITVLHLHLGCNVLNKDGVITRLDGLFIDWVLSNKIPQSEIPKLILRPLSSITEEEVKELIKFEKLDREYVNVAFRRVTGYNDNLTAVEIDYTIVEEDLVLPKTWTFNFYAM